MRECGSSPRRVYNYKGGGKEKDVVHGIASM